MLVLALLTACSTEPRLSFSKPTCQANYLDWAGDLTYYVDAGGGRGDFDVDPRGELQTRVWGEYELGSGDFVYTIEFLPAHWRKEIKVDGYGYAANNGDLDLEAVWTTTDKFDVTSSVMIRDVRRGCETERTELDIYGREWVTEGRFVGAELDYTRTGPLYDFSEPGEYTGVWRSDLSSSESVEISSDGVDYSEDVEDDGEGNVVEDWVWDDADTHQEGHDETDVAGNWTSHLSYTYGNQDCTIDREIDYAGDGGGTLDCGSGGTCDLTYESWACTWDCSDGSQGDCWTSNTRLADTKPRIPDFPRRDRLR